MRERERERTKFYAFWVEDNCFWNKPPKGRNGKCCVPRMEIKFILFIMHRVLLARDYAETGFVRFRRHSRLKRFRFFFSPYNLCGKKFQRWSKSFVDESKEFHIKKKKKSAQILFPLLPSLKFCCTMW